MRNNSSTKRISRTECVRVKGQDSILIHVILEKIAPSKKKTGRGNKEKSRRSYRLIIRQADTDLHDQSWTQATKFPLEGMKIIISQSKHDSVKQNKVAINKALKDLRDQLIDAESQK